MLPIARLGHSDIMVRVTNYDEPAEQDPFGANGDDDESLAAWQSIAPQLQEFAVRRHELAELASQVGQFGLLTSLQSVFDAADQQRELARSFGTYAAPHLAALEEATRAVAALRETTAVLAPLVKFPVLNFHLPTDWFPPNWEEVPGQDVDDLADKAVAIIQGEGIPLVWVPRPQTVRALVRAADADARDSILLVSRDDISDDCTAVLTEVTAAELMPLADLGAHAVGALRDGNAAPAQALATNVFDTLLRDMGRRGVIFDGPLGYFKYDKVRKRIEPVSGETRISQYRAACVLAAAVPALQDYEPADPAPVRFVRHATAHRVGPEQYTPVNAIVAVMLMTSMLREAQSSGW
jgi:hypothetical protein